MSKNLFKFAVPATLMTMMPAIAQAENLKSDDFVGISFWLISMALVASTAFFFLETARVAPKWKTSLVVSGLVTLVAAVHYFYMRDVWVSTGESPIVFRYVDWLLTVPLQIVEFYLILAAIAVVAASLFWRLLIASVVMLVAGYLGEVGAMNVWLAFIIGMAGWIYIIYEIFAGEASKISASDGTPASQRAFNALRIIVTVGWAIYPLGYVLGYAGTGRADALNIIYTLADFVSKSSVGVVIWVAATSDAK